MFFAMACAFASAVLYHPSSSDLVAAAGDIAVGGGLEKVAGRGGGGDVVCPEVCRPGDSAASSLTSILGRLAVADDEACSRCLSCITCVKKSKNDSFTDTSSPTLTFICCLNCAIKFPSFWNLFFTEEPLSLELGFALTSLESLVSFGSLIPALAFLMSSSSCFFLSFSSICAS